MIYEDIKDVDIILDNIKWLSAKMPLAIKKWKDTKPDCRYNDGLVKVICENPIKINGEVFLPIMEWLLDYKLRRNSKDVEYKIKGDTDYFLKTGLRRIFRFVTIAEFFSDNPQYFVTENVDLFTKTELSGKYRDIISTINKRLIGCINTLSFNFIKLANTIKILPEDLIEMKSYLNNICIKKKVQDLRSPIRK